MSNTILKNFYNLKIKTLVSCISILLNVKPSIYNIYIINKNKKFDNV